MSTVTKTLTLGVKEKARYVKILATGNQFKGSAPANITLQAKLYGITTKSYAWYKGTSATVVGTAQSFIIANNQVTSVESYKVIVTATNGQTYEDTISISKVIDGDKGEPGKPGKMPIQREWKQGDIHRNNDNVIDYIYHRATNTWWRLKDGYNNVTAPANPSNAYVQLTAMEIIAVQLIVAEQANLAGFIFKDNKLVSQYPSANDPSLLLDGLNGFMKCNKGEFGGFKIDPVGFNGYVKDDHDWRLTYIKNTGTVDIAHLKRLPNEQPNNGQWQMGYDIKRVSILPDNSNTSLSVYARKPLYENYTPIALSLSAEYGVALEVRTGDIEVEGYKGVSGTWVFGSRTVTIKKGIITDVR
ncbi:hypothetical protein [Myroides odoratimimus]|uniref:Uncharacterized protein n=1 Tax=Myroides odoratimimus CIP 101113 TaxID=883154 RepID=A0AAV3F5L0_9FLAO|nr:hypothetical protein [Myroides odoratimimus]EHO13849.1 hypothetical protein HMPREF9715_00923 [Myroides odoratimimus CIP 101113]